CSAGLVLASSSRFGLGDSTNCARLTSCRRNPASLESKPTLSESLVLNYSLNMSFGQTAFLLIAGLLAGALNSVAGGGGFIAFPAMLFAGIAPIEANASQTIALWPGGVASIGAYRREY